MNTDALNQAFMNARTYDAWQNKELPDALLENIYNAARMAPTSANCSPMRIIFLKTEAAKQRLKPYLMEGNIQKTMTAPVVAIIGMDMQFYEKLPQLFPHTDAASWFRGNDAAITSTAFRNSSLQAAYLILAARLHGVDCGPMSGFDNDSVDKEFFSGTAIKSNMLCNLGYGDNSKLHPRSPRLEFADACKVL